LTSMRKTLQALVFGVVLTIAVVAGVLNSALYSNGWWAQVSVSAPSNVEVKVSDIYGHVAYITGSGSTELGPITNWWDIVYASIAVGNGCSVEQPNFHAVYPWNPYASFTVTCQSTTTTTSTPPPTTTTPPPTITITKTSTTTSVSTTTLTTTSVSTTTTTVTVTQTTTVVSSTTTTVVTTTIPVVNGRNWSWNGLSFIILIIQDIANGFHWLASFFAFKPITSGHADFYVPIVEWGWNYAFGTRIVPIVVNTTTSTITGTAVITHNITATVPAQLTNEVYWKVTELGTASWTISDTYGYVIEGIGNVSGVLKIPGTTDVLSISAPSSCRISPNSTVTVSAGSTVDFYVYCLNYWMLYAVFLNPHYCTFNWGLFTSVGDVFGTSYGVYEWSVIVKIPWSQKSIKAWAGGGSNG